MALKLFLLETNISLKSLLKLQSLLHKVIEIKIKKKKMIKMIKRI